MIPLTTIISRVRTRYEAESGGSSIRFSDDILTDYTNEGMECLAEATGFYERYCTVPLQAYRSYYDIRGFTPETVVSIKSVWYSERNDWLTPYSADALPYDWENAIGTPQAFFIRGIFWLGLYPIPSATTGTLRVYFKGIPSRLTHPQAVIADLPPDYIPAVEDYVLYEMFGSDANDKASILWWSSYQKREQSLLQAIDRRLVGARAGRMGNFGGRLR